MVNSDHVAVSVSTNFPSNAKGDVLFDDIVYDYCPTYWNGFFEHLGQVLLVVLVSGFRLELMHLSLIVNIRLNLTHPHDF